MADIEVNIITQLPPIEVEISPVAVQGGGQTTTQVFEAGEVISSTNAVYLQNGLLYKFDSNNPNLQGRFLGIAKTAGGVGTLIDVFVSGVAIIPTWGLTTDANYYAGLNGIIATVPNGILNEFVGIAIASDKLLIKNFSIKTS